MKRFLVIATLVLVAAILTSCQIDVPASSGDAVETGGAEISENSVTVCGYLNVDVSVRNTCMFGILYSTDTEPSKDSSVFRMCTELDSNNKFEVVLKDLSPNTEYFYKAYVRYASGAYQYGKVKSFKTKEETVTDGSIVDLGLSVKWATCNLGASKPEEYGSYYQWGGLQDVTDNSIYLAWSNCPYHKGSDHETGWTKYVSTSNSSYWSVSGSPDNKTVLDPEDDVAHVRLGGKWRMPTGEECRELIDNCTSKWTVLNGVNGWKFTSKKNDRSIFFPAAGYRHDDGLYVAGFRGHYWSSSLPAGYSFDATGFDFYLEYIVMCDDLRYYGLSVRPVSE